MKWARKIGYALRSVFVRGRKERELNEEMEAHLQFMIDDGIERGLSPEASRLEALRDFGNRELVKDEVRDAWGTRLIGGLCRDLRFAWKQIFKSKGYSVTILLILGLCVGLNSSIFSGVYTTLVEPFAFEESDRVMVLGKKWRERGEAVYPTSPIDFLEIADKQESFSSLGLVKQESVDVSTTSKPKHLKVDYATAGVWDVAGIEPLFGRVYTDEEVLMDEKIAVISYAFWKSEYARSADVLGRSVRVNGQSHVVIGVMPRDFNLVFVESELWLPRVFSDFERREDQRGSNSNTVLGRLRDGVSFGDAQHEMSALYQHYLERNPGARDNAERSGENYAVLPVAGWISSLYPEIKGLLLGLQVAALLLLLIGCFNITSLMLARGASRVPEVGLRMALGAGRLRIAGQMVTENFLLFFFGVLVTISMTDFFNYIFSGPWMGPQPPIGRRDGSESTLAPLIFSVLAICGAMALSSIIPVLMVSGKRVASCFAGGRITGSSSGNRNRIQSFLIVGQVALSCFLLICTGLFLYNVKGAMNKDFGYELEGRAALELTLPAYRYGSGAKQRQFQENLVSQLKEAPGVLDAAMSYRAPMDFSPGISGFKAMGREALPGEEYPGCVWYLIQPNYHDLMGIDLVDGRLFGSLDTEASEPVAILSKSYLQYMGEEQAVGSSIEFWGRTFRVVGIVDDTKDVPHLMDEPDHTVYFVSEQWEQTKTNPVIMLRHGGDLGVFKNRLAQWMNTADPDLEYKVADFDELLSDSLVMNRVPLIYVSVFAVLSIVLTSCGLYGFLSYVIEQRKVDLGIRKAMGASSVQILGHTLKSNALRIGLGIGVGAGVCLLISPGLGQMLKEVSPVEPMVYLMACMILGSTSLLAIAVPSIRAAFRPAMNSLRAD